MAISPINLSRTSFNLRTLSLIDSLRQNTLKLFLEQNRVATGNRLNAPSEDPVLAAKAMQLTEVLEHQDQILANIRHADSFLAAADSGIGEISTLLIDAHNIALEMVNSTSSQDQRDSMAELVDGIIDQLVSVGNRTYQGVYLFGGFRTREAPFTQLHGGVEYHGDASAILAHVDEAQDAQINLTGNDIFGVLSGQVSGWVDLDPALEEDTRLADVKGTTGNGVADGRILISLDSPATGFTVDLAPADTIGDVIDLINNAAEQAGLTVGAGNQFYASINAAGDGIQIVVGGGNVTITDISEGTTARDLGIRGTAAGTLVGSDIDPRLTGHTSLSSLLGGTGVTLGSIQITNGSLSETVDLSGATTVQDVLNRINSAGTDARATINANADGIDVINLMSGLSMSVGEAGGDTAEVLGIRSLHAGTSLSELNHGQGVDIREGYDDLAIYAKDGSTFNVRLDGSTTIQDVLDRINAAATAAGVGVTASQATTGNGIRLVDTTGGAGVLRVERADASAAIDGLGLNKTTNGTELIGDDVNGIKPDSVFSALIDLHAALVGGGEEAEQKISLAAERLEFFIEHVSRTQGVVGARSKAMGIRLDLTEGAVLSTRSLLSEVKDLDYTEAVTRFQQAQTTLQANLMTGSRLLQLSLLDYI
jgi:flagellar hook-associated protein 3